MKYEFEGITFSVASQYKITLEKKEANEGILKIGIGIDFVDACVPEEVKIVWDIPAVGILSEWNPSLDASVCLMPDWWGMEVKSRAVYGAPVKSHIGMCGENRCTVALTDAVTPCIIKSGIYEETAMMRYKLTLFSKCSKRMSHYETQLVIDMRNIPFYDALADVVKLWENEGYKEAYVPEYAMEPMYSTWYSMHQELSDSELLNELEKAKEYGMESVIIDDGWQTDDNQRGYSFCGDWQVAGSKIPNMKKFVSDVHKIGMKLLLWYNVPYVGVHSSAYENFKGMFLYEEVGKWGVLDPRYKKVREYLCNIYEKAVIDWDIDGLKLDFIDSLELRDESVFKDDMDIQSLEDGVCTLLSEIKNKLLKIKSDIMIEYRQNYMGPAMRMSANMMRAADSPLDAIRNRIYCLGLKMISGKCAVHSDMLMWNMADSVENAAKQIINVLFAVPQISVRISRLPEEHQKMLRFYIDFWKKNKKCITSGKIRLYNPEANYSVATIESDKELIAVFYSANMLNIENEFEKITLVNGSGNRTLVVINKSVEFKAIIRCYNCMGECTEKEYVFSEGVNIFDTPISGMTEIIKK